MYPNMRYTQSRPLSILWMNRVRKTGVGVAADGVVN